MKQQNAKWSKDELILVLDHYFRYGPLHSRANSDENLGLCNRINELNRFCYNAGITRDLVERSPYSVYMKSCNFLRLDPAYKGVGLTKGNKLEEVVWNEFVTNSVVMTSKAESIRKCSSERGQKKALKPVSSPVYEGGVLSYTHKAYEREIQESLMQRNSHL